MTGEPRKERILRQVVVGLFLIGLAMTWAGRASATTFEKAINPNYSYLEDVQQTSDGGYVLGAVVSVTAYVALVVKLDSSGNLQWQKQYQFSGGSSQVYALKQTSDGGYVWPASSKTPTATTVPLSSSWIQAGTSSGSRLTASPQVRRTSGKRRTEVT